MSWSTVIDVYLRDFSVVSITQWLRFIRAVVNNVVPVSHLSSARRITTQFVAVHADSRSPLPVSLIFSEVGRCIE